MFWGLILKPGKKYYKELEQDFHLTHAALDLADSNGDVQVMLTTENITYLLCTLNKTIPQAVLDQEFAIGDKISFATKGQGVVHLTGNVLPDGMDDLGEEEEDDEEEMDEEEGVPATNGKPPAALNGNAKQAGKEAAGAKQEQQKKGAVRTLQDGLMVEDLKVGNGPEAKPGKKIAVYYEGRLKSNNKVFDSTSKGPGLKFALGRGEVIKGWDLGVAGMKVGGKRRLVIPHKLAYGTKGSPPVIPPCSTLVFEVELKKVF
uniref:peptidylprolyl isomerase n=1 Tax=Anopheles maculatus TaxID=74869 RepID=A0A182SEJ0_9DIPT